MRASNAQGTPLTANQLEMSWSQQVPREIGQKPPACFQAKARELCRRRLAIPSTFRSTAGNIYKHFPGVRPIRRQFAYEISPSNSFCFPLHRAAGGTVCGTSSGFGHTSLQAICPCCAWYRRLPPLLNTTNVSTGIGRVAATHAFACSKIITMRAK